MSETPLKERLRAAADAPVPSPTLGPVSRRARILRARRVAGAALATAITVTAITLPLSGLRHLGEQDRSPQPTTESVFGDGRAGFVPRQGWTDLQKNDVNVCTSTESFASSDSPGDPGESTFCTATAGALSPDGIVMAVLIESGPYRWEEPNGNFPERSFPISLQDARIDHNWETQPDPDIPQYLLLGTVAHRWLDVRVYFGRQDPTSEQLAAAQTRLDDLFMNAPASLGGSVAFLPDQGWQTKVDTPPVSDGFATPGDVPVAAWTTNADLPPGDPTNTYPAGPSNDQIAALPAGGIVVAASQTLFTSNPIERTGTYPAHHLTLGLDEFELSSGGQEGLAREDLTQASLSASVMGRPIFVHVWFGTLDVTDELRREAQDALDRLVVVPTPPATDALDRFGIALPLPAGWDGFLYSFGLDANLVASSAPIDDPFDEPVMRRSLSPTDVAIVLSREDWYIRAQLWAPDEPPFEIGPYDRCDGCEVMDGGEISAPGHVLFNHTFTYGGAPFDLYVEFGSEPTQASIDQVNTVLAGLRLEPLTDPAVVVTPEPGTNVVGAIYDGDIDLDVTADTEIRTLSPGWLNASIHVPAGWSGQNGTVAGMQRPESLLTVGSWAFPPGGYCGPLPALQRLPADGALVWIDTYRGGAPGDLEFSPWPDRVVWDASTFVADSSPCVGNGEPAGRGSGVWVKGWSLGGRAFVVHVALGPDAGPDVVANVTAALESFRVG